VAFAGGVENLALHSGTPDKGREMNLRLVSLGETKFVMNASVNQKGNIVAITRNEIAWVFSCVLV